MRFFFFFFCRSADQCLNSFLHYHGYSHQDGIFPSERCESHPSRWFSQWRDATAVAWFEIPCKLFRKNIYIYCWYMCWTRQTDARCWLTFSARHKKNSLKKVQVAVRLFSTDSIRSVQSHGFTSRFAVCSDDLAQKRKLAFYSFSATPENTKTGSAQNKRTS